MVVGVAQHALGLETKVFIGNLQLDELIGHSAAMDTAYSVPESGVRGG
jgi:hypothetical protein